MSKKTNIAEILRNYPKGTKLYSPVLGQLALEFVDETERFPIGVKYADDRFAGFMADGRYVDVDDAECCIFPSYGIRSWEFMLWKKGDVVAEDKTGRAAMFGGWANDEYTSFNAKWVMGSKGFVRGGILSTALYFPCDESNSKWFVRKLEILNNGKFNPDTLEVEPVQPKHEFKPFDKILGRDDNGENWTADFFSHTTHDIACDRTLYVGVGGSYYQCIPYNEETAHLLGTTDPYGEK